MLELVGVLVIVAAAAFFTFRRFYKTATSRDVSCSPDADAPNPGLIQCRGCDDTTCPSRVELHAESDRPRS